MQVCPAGIDIRNGLQNECIGCAACIDACDDVMRKMDYPTGLIRYATSNGVAQGPAGRDAAPQRCGRACWIHGALLGGRHVPSPSGWRNAPAGRHGRDPRPRRDGAPGEDGCVQNLYRVQPMNCTERTTRYELASKVCRGWWVDGSRVSRCAPGEVRPFTRAPALPAEAAQVAHAGRAAGDAHPDRAGSDEATLREHSTFLVPR